MAVFRMYTGDDNETHLEAQDLASHPMLKSPMATQHITFREMAAGYLVLYIENSFGKIRLRDLKEKRRKRVGLLMSYYCLSFS